MHVLRHSDEVFEFTETYTDQCVTALLLQRMEELIDDGTRMEELVFFVILSTGEGVEQLQRQVDIQVMTDQGAPLWEVIEEHATCYEMVFVLSSSGYGALVFAPKATLAQDMLALCQKHAYRNPPDPPPDAIDAPVALDTAHRGGFFAPIQAKEPNETSR